MVHKRQPSYESGDDSHHVIPTLDVHTIDSSTAVDTAGHRDSTGSGTSGIEDTAEPSVSTTVELSTIPTAEKAALVLANQKAFAEKSCKQLFEKATKHLQEHERKAGRLAFLFFQSDQEVKNHIILLKILLKMRRLTCMSKERITIPVVESTH